MNARHSRARGLMVLNLTLFATLLLTACGTPPAAATPAPTAPPQAITLLEWSGYELPEFWKPFADAHPTIAPAYSFFAEDSEAFTKAASGFQFDLVHPCVNYWQLYVDQGLLQPIDTTRLKNWSGVLPELAALGQINGQQYYVPYDWGFESILVRTDKVTTMPTAWADLWNPEYKGHVSLYDSGEANHIMTAMALGFDPWATTPKQNEQIKQKLIELKPNLLNYWVDFTEINQLIISGDVWVGASTWQDAYIAAVAEGAPVDYITPTEGRMSWVCGYGLSANAQNVDLAYDYLDAMLSPEPMATFANEYGYGVSNANALPLIDPEFVAMFHLDDPSILQDTVFYKPLTEAQREQMTGAWDEVKAAP